MGVYLPSRVVSTEEVVRGCNNPVLLPLEQLTGIRSRRVAGDGEYAIDLAKKAVLNCLASSAYGPEAIDLLICCNISRFDGPSMFSFEPSTSLKLREHFGFSNALVLDVANACAGVFTALSIVESYLEMKLIRRAMVVSGEYITHLTDTAQREISGPTDPRLACLTLGDAGVALILESSSTEGAGFQGIDIFTLGRHSSYCIAKTSDAPHGGAIMLTDSVRLVAAATQHIGAHFAQLDSRGAIALDELDHVIMHQTSRHSLIAGMNDVNRRLSRRVLHEGNVVINLLDRGNTASTSHFVALNDSILNGTVRSGDKVLFGITASGLTIGAALYVFDDLPKRLLEHRRGDATETQAIPEPRASMPFTRPSRRVGIESVGIVAAQPDTARTTVELGRLAAEDCLARSERRRDEIALLIFAGVYRTDFISEPAVAALLAGELAVNDAGESPESYATLAFDVCNDGLGFLNACHVAIQKIQAGRGACALVVTSEIENNAHFPGKPLLGLKETGSAILLHESPDSRSGFGPFLFRYFTEYSAAYTSYGSWDQGKSYMSMSKDPRLEDYYLSCITTTVAELLEKTGLDSSQLDLVFPPQFSPGFTARLSERLGMPGDRFVDVAVEGEDYLTSSLAYGMWHARQRGLIRGGGVGLIICVGAGIQVGCAIYYF